MVETCLGNLSLSGGRSSRGKDLTKKKEKDLNRANRLLREKKKE